jgi:hypothetical protein
MADKGKQEENGRLLAGVLEARIDRRTADEAAVRARRAFVHVVRGTARRGAILTGRGRTVLEVLEAAAAEGRRFTEAAEWPDCDALWLERIAGRLEGLSWALGWRAELGIRAPLAEVLPAAPKAAALLERIDRATLSSAPAPAEGKGGQND